MPASPEVAAAARVTLAFVGVFVVNVLFQFYGKRRSASMHVKAKKALAGDGAKDEDKSTLYNRYSNSDLVLLVGDRVVGNYIEWAVPFLSLFWMSMIITGQGENLGWSYVVLRLLYIVLAASGGITYSGVKPKLLLATVPMYVVLFILGRNVYLAVV
jgi:hypothetical protein